METEITLLETELDHNQEWTTERLKEMPWLINEPEILSVRATSAKTGEKLPGSQTFVFKHYKKADNKHETIRDEEVILPPGLYNLVTNGAVTITPEGDLILLVRRSDIKDPMTKANASVGNAYQIKAEFIEGKENPPINLNEGDKRAEFINSLQAPIVTLRKEKKLASLEDMRITPMLDKDGNIVKYVITAQVFSGGVFREDMSIHHIVQVGIAQSDAEFKHIEPVTAVIGSSNEEGRHYKNGVYMGKNEAGEDWMLCRSMEETNEIEVAKSASGLKEEWHTAGKLENFWENFPKDIKDKVERIGPGTNPIYIPRLNGWLVGFHWVINTIDNDGSKTESYLGGFMLLKGDEKGPEPYVAAINPWGISPFSASDSSKEHYRLFSKFENKEVIFPMSIVKSGDQILLSAGYQDTATNLYRFPAEKLKDAFANKI